ncbi:MAG: DUF6785 family protein [Armatimonadota bacterium]
MNKKKTGGSNSGVTFKAILTALILIPLNNYWIFYTEVVRYAGHPTTISLFYNAVFILILLICLNALLRRIVPSLAYTQGELLTIYIMINIASALAGHDMLQVLIPEMTYPFNFATPENKWAARFLDKIPTWLSVRDPEVMRGYWTGASTLYDPKVLAAWSIPVLMWTLFILTLLTVMLCMTVILRKQWTENEKLTYPLVQLPLDITSENNGFFRNRLLWTGIGIAVFIDLIQGLHVLYPSIPGIPIKELNLVNMITTRPWSAVGWTPVHFYPFGIGLGILLPLDLSFSAWFFYLIWKAEVVISAMLGWDQIPRFPYINHQSFGAYMGICLFAIWTGRNHLAKVFGNIFNSQVDAGDEREPIRYRTAALGVLIGMLLLFIFASALGMSWWLVILFFGIYLAMSIGITRMRAELGPPAHDLHMGGPDTILPEIIGTSHLGPANLVALSMMFWFNRAYRAHPMPFQLEGFKMAEKASISYRKLFGAIILAVLVGTIASFWSQLHLTYQMGAGAKMGPPNVALIFGSEPFLRLDSWMNGSAPSTIGVRWAIFVGFALTIVLNSLRMKMAWFPFHPVGYAISSSWSMGLLWVSMFIAWLVKLLLLRYGGLKLYRSAVPLFLGIVIGECVMGSLWTIIGIVLNVQTYAFWP